MSGTPNIKDKKYNKSRIELQKRVYIETDVHTANLVEVLLDEIRSLHEKVDRLERFYGTNE